MLFSQYKNRSDYSFRFEVAPLSITVAILMVQFFIFKDYTPHVPLIIGICITGIFMALKGRKWAEMEKNMYRVMKVALPTTIIILCVGMMIAASIAAGTVQTVLKFGLDIISPSIFLPATCILTTIVSLATGTSWGTLGTVGLAMLGIGDALGIPNYWTIGAICSGSFFGDKMSPLSDTTGIAASTVGVDLFEHIKNMSYTTIPALLLTAAALVWAVPDVVSGSLNSVQKLSGQLQASGLVHGYALLPFAVLVVLALFKVDAILTMLATIAVSIAITFVHTPLSAGQLGGWLFAGFKPEHVGEGIAKLVSRGGLESMFFTQTVVMLALSLGGLLFALGIVPALLDAMRRFLTNAGRATFCVAMTSVGVNILIGEQYLSILLAGETFKPVYAKLGLHPRNLSRTLEDAGTVINPLVPWSVCGVFIAKVLGVSVLSYLPYAFFCYLCLILTVLFGFTGVTLSKVETAQE